MPQKKKPAGTRRPRAKIPKGKDGPMSPEDRHSKLELLLMDYDEHVEGHLKQMELEEAEDISTLKQWFRLELARIPKKYRDMTIGEFRAVGGTMTLNTQHLSTVLNTDLSASCKPLDSISESSGAENVAPSTNRKRKICPPPTTGRRKPPLKTPKFDPRLPNTPAVPGMRHMSFRLSPRTVPNVEVSIPMSHKKGREEVLCISQETNAEELKSTLGGDLDHDMLLRVKALWEKLPHIFNFNAIKD